LADELNNTIIVLMGFAGTGKYTIGRELAQLTGAKLIDNHLINNSLFTAIDVDGVTPLPKEIWPKIKQIRRIVYETIRELSRAELSFIFTVQLIEEDPQDHVAFADLVELARARRSLLVPIRLICEVEELCRRVVGQSRVEMLKHVNPESTRKTVLSQSVLDPDHPNLNTIDVTHVSALESAMTIWEKVRSISG
jgi:hypothetical protein